MRYRFQSLDSGIKGHETLGEALTADGTFMERYIEEQVKGEVELIDTENKDDFAEWCLERELDQEDSDARWQYASQRVGADDDLSFHWDSIKDWAKDPACPWIKEYPITGVWSEAYGSFLDTEDIIGFCPTCGQPLATSDKTYLPGGDGKVCFYCGNCGAGDPIEGFEDKFGRKFNHLAQE